MSQTEFSGGVWPPRGWEQFKNIELLSYQTIYKDPISATVTGLCYKVEPIMVFNKKIRTCVYNVTIERWEYSINNDSQDLPVLSFLLGEAKVMPMARELVVENIKVCSRPIKTTAKSSHRVLMAALSLMRHINNDHHPDVNNLLRLYKLHPSQGRSYNAPDGKEVSKSKGKIGDFEEKKG